MKPPGSQLPAGVMPETAVYCHGGAGTGAPVTGLHHQFSPAIDGRLRIPELFSLFCATNCPLEVSSQRR